MIGAACRIAAVRTRKWRLRIKFSARSLLIDFFENGIAEVQTESITVRRDGAAVQQFVQDYAKEMSVIVHNPFHKNSGIHEPEVDPNPVAEGLEDHSTRPQDEVEDVGPSFY